MNKKLLVLILCALGGINLPTYAQSYSDRSGLISDFLNASLSDSLWLDQFFETPRDSVAYFLREFPHKEDEKVQAQYKAEFWRNPWLADYMFPQKGLPKSGVLNKWEGEISVGIDWPPYGPAAYIDAAKGSPYSENMKEAYPVFIEGIERVLPELSALTGLGAKFIKPDSTEDKQVSFARIRIVPIKDTYLQNDFKTLYWGPDDPSPESPTVRMNYEIKLWGAVPFTPNVRSQVDGYLLPNDNNTIGLVVCKIKADLDKQIIGALIKECLVRALGLPNLSNNKESIISNWNQQSDYRSFLPKLDGKKKSVTYHAGNSPDVKTTSFIAPSLSLSEYDKALIKLLYCKDIKPGMTKIEILQILSKNNQCFN